MRVEYKKDEIRILYSRFAGLKDVEISYLEKFDGATVKLEKDIDGDVYGICITKKEEQIMTATLKCKMNDVEVKLDVLYTGTVTCVGAMNCPHPEYSGFPHKDCFRFA